MDENPTTEPGKHIEAQKKLVSGDGQPGKLFGCGSFAIEAKAQSFIRLDGVLSLPTARIRRDIETPAGYLVHP